MKDTEPYTLFDSWFAEAELSELNDPNAMALSTVSSSGRPSTRMVLLKGHGRDVETLGSETLGSETLGGFIFYTNLESRKAGELIANPYVALLFHWKSLRRQIRIEGALKRVSDSTADAYFATRSRNSQLGAWASDQSRPLDSRATFEARFTEFEARYDGAEVPRPPHWSGHIVVPDRFEFWQDREFRLHERWIYQRDAGGDGGDAWQTGMLYP